jgi:hypothetical protein
MSSDRRLYIIIVLCLLWLLETINCSNHTFADDTNLLNLYYTLNSRCVASASINPFTAEVAIMRLLGSAPKSHLCDQRRRSKVIGLSMTLFIDLGCLSCNQTQRAFNVFKNTLNWLKIDSVDQQFYWLECGNFSQDAGTPGSERVIAFSQLAVKGLNWSGCANSSRILCIRLKTTEPANPPFGNESSVRLDVMEQHVVGFFAETTTVSWSIFF